MKVYLDDITIENTNEFTSYRMPRYSHYDTIEIDVDDEDIASYIVEEISTGLKSVKNAKEVIVELMKDDLLDLNFLKDDSDFKQWVEANLLDKYIGN